MRKYILVILMVVIALQVQAQVNNTGSSGRFRPKRATYGNNYQVRSADGNMSYDHEFSVGARLNTDGWGGFLELGRRKNEVITNIYQFELGEKKSPKEDKTARPSGYDYFGNLYTLRPYVLGKRNIFYQAKLGIGQRYLIGGKGNKNGVEVSAIYTGGISIGLLRPYYIELGDSTGSGSSYVKYSPDNKTRFLNPNLIIGGPGLSRGWNELEVVPGLHARAGIRFDWAAFNATISAIEVSANAEYYIKEIPIMVDVKPKQFFLNASVALVFGKRW